MASSRERELHLGRACQRVVLLRADTHERSRQKAYAMTPGANYYDWDVTRRQPRLNYARQLIGKYVKILSIYKYSDTQIFATTVINRAT